MRRRFLLSPAKKDIDLNNYLTFHALEDGLSIALVSLSQDGCQYNIDNSVWEPLAASDWTPSINAGQVISFRGNLTPVSNAGIGTFSLSAKCAVGGNCMSMLYGNEAENNLSLSGKSYAFYRLFYNATNLIDVDENFLPATTLATYCYRDMFRGCTNLKSAPNLPATAVQDACYSYMFYGCRTLTKVPSELPAKTLKQSCYNNMFYSCRSLTKAPSILATKLATQCCRNMFNACIALEEAPVLPVETLVNLCYGNMFTGCSSLKYVKALFTTAPSSTYTANWLSKVASNGTFVKNKNATWDVTGASGVPEGWTVITE